MALYKFENIFLDKSWSLFNVKDAPLNSIIGAISFEKNINYKINFDSLKLNLFQESNFVIDYLNEHNYKYWLFITDTVWQDNSRIIQYKKLWKRFPTINKQFTRKSSELKKVFDGKVKYSGMIEIDETNLLGALNILQMQQSSIMIASKNINFNKLENIEFIFDSCLPNSENEINYSFLVSSVCQNDNDEVVIRSYVDDQFMTIDFFMNERVLKEIPNNKDL